MELFGFDTRWLYTALVALVALERGVELSLSRRNARRLLGRGAVETGSGHYPAMVLLHATFLAACVLEVWLFDRRFIPWLAASMLFLLAGTMALRYWVVATLGERWSTRVIYLPGLAPVDRGPYRWLRHPNYLAVVLELIALPLIHTAWFTAALWSGANAALLRTRVRVENAALVRHASRAGGQDR